MFHAFIDESEYQDQYFCLSALIVSDKNLVQLNCQLGELVQEYARTTAVKANSELHGYDLMQQKGDWHGVPMGITASIYLKALGIVNDCAEALYVETIDRVKQAKRYTVPFNHRTVAIGFILERVNEFAERSNYPVRAYLDDHYTAPEGRKEFLHYKLNGTLGYRSSKLERVESFDFYDSRSLYGLQAADLCCYAYQRKLFATNVNLRVENLQEKMWGAIEGIRDAGRTRIWPK